MMANSCNKALSIFSLMRPALLFVGTLPKKSAPLYGRGAGKFREKEK